MEQGRDRGSAPSRCSTGGFASPGIEGSRRGKPGRWRGPPGWLLALSAGVQPRRQDESPPSLQTQAQRSRGHKPGWVPPQEETSRGPGRGRTKTKRGRGSGREGQPGWSGAGCGPSRQGMPGPVRPSPGGASIRIAAVTGGGARPGRRARRGAALQHCRSPLLPRSLLRPPPPLGSGGPAQGTHRPRRAPLPLARGICRRRAGVSRAAPHPSASPEPGMQPWRRDVHPPAGFCGRCQPGSHQPRAGGGTGHPRRGIACPARSSPRRQCWPAVRPDRLPPFPCHPPRRSVHAISPDGAPRLAWAKRCPHGFPARALGLVPRAAGTATETGQG